MTRGQRRQQRREDTCARKIRYATWEEAREAAIDVWRNEPQGTNPPSPYPCARIGEPHYHIGHLRRGNGTA